ncbi:MAG TPA: hypothetical protein VGP71_13420 [Burkholderiales bacterium]|jgi:hypothetical protein|nr:hypothetical protein [Burkholderiales bacterium]
MNLLSALILAAALAGCATLERPFSDHLESAAIPVRDCAAWFAALDAAVDGAGVRDAQDARIRGFPYLRVDRSLSALRERAASDVAATQAFALRLAALDYSARKAEIANLPDERLTALPVLLVPGLRREAVARTRDCAQLLREIDFAKPETRQWLLERATVPDDYSMALRVAGLYALTRVAFAAGVQRWESETSAAFAQQPRGTSLPLIRYAPPAAPSRSRDALERLLAASSANPLGLPEPAAQDLAELLAAFAPSFEVEVAGDYDRFGQLRWLRGREIPSVDAAEQVVYAQITRTLYRGRVLLQLVYTIWFPERPPSEPGDILAGLLDGLTWRVTLAPDGEPLVYDTIHACGCYHMFFPTPRARALPAPNGFDEWAFSPQQLPRVEAGERPVLHVANGTHYIERVSIARGMDSVAHYELRDYDELRSLARLDGGSRSAFGPDGLIAGTERPERYRFWPTGVRSAGAMRQWGRHATAFVGRRHFDDAHLFEQRFEFDLR